MNRITYIREVQKALELFSEGAKTLEETLLKCYDTGFQVTLNDYLLMYAKLNYDFSTYLLFKLVEAYSKDKDDTAFNDIMKQLEGDNGNQG